MRKRLFGKKGMTVVEVLVAVAILAIFVSMAAVGTSALFGTSEKMMSVSKAAVLGADLMDVMRNEISYGENVEDIASSSELRYDSASYGDGCTLTVREGRLVILRTETGSGTAETETYSAVGEAAYDEVSVGTLSFANGTNGAIVVTLSICTGDGKTLWQNTAAICPLYLKATF